MASEHNWQVSFTLVIMGKPITYHSCAKCGMVKEFSSPTFWTSCWDDDLAKKAQPQGDHKPDGSGLDDGPFLPGQAPRKPYTHNKSASELAAARRAAWETRRHVYGPKGHR